MTPTLSTGSLFLRPFQASDLDDFHALHANPAVMKDLGGPINRDVALEKLSRYIHSFTAHGYGRMAVFDGSDFAGYVGVQRLFEPEHPLGPHDEIGWRIHSRFWGRGIASRAALLCLEDAFSRVSLPHVLSYTAPENLRSQAVMARLPLSRIPQLDFFEEYPPLGTWTGLVWRITASDWANHRSGGME